MNFYRKEIAGSLKLLKSIIKKDNGQCIAGVLYDNGTLIADNLALRMEIKLDVPETLTDDKFILPIGAVDYIESLTGDYFDIDATETKITVKSGRSKARFAAVKVENFPPVLSGNEDETVEILACEFQEKVAKVIHACAADGIYSGVLIKGKTSFADIVGCNGFTVAKETIGCKTDMNVVIPADAIKKILQLDGKGTWTISKVGNKVKIKCGNVTIWSNLLAGTYIEYEKVYRENTGRFAKVDKTEIVEVLKRAKVFIKDGTKAAVIITKEIEYELSLYVETAVAVLDEKISYDGNITDGLKIAFNVNYLLDAISPLQEDEVEMQIENAVTACQIEEKGYSALVLPVRIKKGE